MKRALFIDRDGTIVCEPDDEQVDSFSKLRFVEGAITSLATIARLTDYELVMVTNQDGLGTSAFPEDTFWPVHRFILSTLEGEGVKFDDVLIDRSFPAEGLPTRKPGTGMMGKYMSGDYDLVSSFVIGDRDTDMQLAANMGCRGLRLSPEMPWSRIAEICVAGERRAEVHRKTSETDILCRLNLDGTGRTDISTGIGFFDHMLSQIPRHGNADLYLHCKGDLEVDAHHSIEDTALTLGECLRQCLSDKRGLLRYGFSLPMDDSSCSVTIDFGGRPWLQWNTEFHRELIGEMPTEMFPHFFHSLAAAAQMNIAVRATGDNEHHKIEGIFKAFAHVLAVATHRDILHYYLPSSKDTL